MPTPNAIGRVLVLAGALLAGQAHASCEAVEGSQGGPPGATAHALQDALDRAETALTELDVDAFRRGVQEAEALLPCVQDRLPPALIAEFHRFWGLRAFGDRDPLAAAAFAAARRLEPSYRFPETLIPTGNPVLNEYTRLDPGERAVVAVEPPARGALLFDGQESTERPAEWPVVVQHLTGSGVDFTAFLLPDRPLPDYLTLSEAPPPQIQVRSYRKPLLIGTASAMALTGVLYGVALHGHARYVDTERNPLPDDVLPGLRTRTNALVVVSAVTATAAVGGGVALALTW